MKLDHIIESQLLLTSQGDSGVMAFEKSKMEEKRVYKRYLYKILNQIKIKFSEINSPIILKLNQIIDRSKLFRGMRRLN